MHKKTDEATARSQKAEEKKGKGRGKGNGKANDIAMPKKKKKKKTSQTSQTRKNMDAELEGPYSLHTRSLPTMAYIKASDGFVCSMSVKNNPCHILDMEELKKKLEAGEISTRRVANQSSKDQSRRRQDEIDED